MKTEEKPIELYARLRAAILDILGGIEDAAPMRPDHTLPNSSIRDRLQSLRDTFLIQSQEYGFHILKRHCECGRALHQGYVMDPVGGIAIEFYDARFVWHHALDQREDYAICPCSNSPELVKHHVIHDAIIDVSGNREVCNKLLRVFRPIYAALGRAADKRPRSAVREELLVALLEINDALLPAPMEDYVRTLVGR